MKPIDYEALKKDAIYLGILKTLEAMRNRYVKTLIIRLNLLSRLNEKLIVELHE